MTRDNSNASGDDRLRTTRLSVSRMNCPWKARRIADALQRVDGVAEASPGSRSDTVVVQYDPARTSEATMAAAVERPSSADGQTSTPSRSGRQSGGRQCRCRGRTR